MKIKYKKVFPTKEKWLLFQKQTALSNLTEAKDALPRLISVVYYKKYPRFERILLPEIDDSDFSLKEVLCKRSSTRTFSSQKPTLRELSSLLLFSVGMNPSRLIKDTERRFYPSAGARYPLETYIISNDHNVLGSGLFHYHLQSHSLERLPYSEVQPIEFIGQANKALSKAPLFIIFTAVFNRSTIKYGPRAYRYAYLEAGHSMQNMYLLATAYQINCCSIGGYIDEKINTLLDLETEKEQVVYMTALG